MRFHSCLMWIKGINFPTTLTGKKSSRHKAWLCLDTTEVPLHDQNVQGKISSVHVFWDFRHSITLLCATEWGDLILTKPCNMHHVLDPRSAHNPPTNPTDGNAFLVALVVHSDKAVHIHR